MFYKFYKCFVLICLFLTIYPIYAIAQVNPYDEALKTAIIHGDLKYISENLPDGDINASLTPGEPSLLIISINSNQPKIAKFLLTIKKADPNRRYKGLSPLMYAIKTSGNKCIKILVEAGANVNDLDSLGNHAFMMGALNQPPSIMRYLFRKGAWFSQRNKNGYTATDFVLHNNNHRTKAFLRRIYTEHLPSYTDGPYIQYMPKNKLKITYLKHDSAKRIYSKKENITALNQLDNYPFDKKLIIKQTFTRDSTYYQNVQKLVVIGDIHGQCDSLQKFLIVNNITDAKLNWAFGNGHIVFLGDILDRGEKVTETLWLVYQLEQQAEQQGGKVHILLGNHELLVFDGKTNYTAEKYQLLAKNLSITYQKLYSYKTVLGKWLRSKNTILKINDHLFVHGGLHPNLLKEKISLDSINNLIYKYLNHKKKKEIPNTPALNFMLSENGPFWFRGLITNKVIGEKEVDLILQYYSAKRIFVGHTKGATINILFNQKVWGMDVPFYLYTGNPLEAVLIETNNYFKINTSGQKEKITVL